MAPRLDGRWARGGKFAGARNGSHLRVEGQVVELPQEYFDIKEEVENLTISFLIGAKLFDIEGQLPKYWGNTSYCFYNISEVLWSTFPMYLTFIQEDSPSTWQKINVTSQFMRVVASGMYTCNDMAKQMYTEIKPRQDEFGDWLQFTYGFINNMLA
mmetsp:Transcript_13360/g.22720  ORF Transcript_13360/g.22720 Transcript_13360/m.22720 type:complete len:156 (+) Transcript_13360:534-1001(+)